jgi:superfamily II DNA helicase RecQ
MLASFFINDPSAVGKYRVKGHAEAEFWEWCACWSVMIKTPSDLGYNSSGYVLPDLITKSIIVTENKPSEGMLFALVAHTMQERRAARKNSLEERVKSSANIANSTNDQYLVWCDLNSESEELCKQIEGAVEVKGSHSDEIKTERMQGFISGKYRVLVTKPTIAGFGLNMQNCHKMIFTGLSDSFEQYYQAVRRCWRFGQKNTVEVFVITADTEGNVVSNIQRKQKQADELSSGIVKNMSSESMRNVKCDLGFAVKYKPQKQIVLPSFLTNK